MRGIRPKQYARMGEFYLEEAVLDVLLEARYKEKCIGAAEISRRSGIYRDRGKADVMNDAIVTGLLVKLHGQDRVERCTQEGSGLGGWELTNEEFQSRCDDAV